VKFVVLLVGVSLIIVGLLAYVTVPNLHQIATTSRQLVTSPANIPVGPGSESETPENVTLVSGKSNELVVNLTVTQTGGALSSIEFKLFSAHDLGSCMQQTTPTGCLVDVTVSNQTIIVPMNLSTTTPDKPATFFFGFANKDSNSKLVAVSASLSTSSVETVVARDGYVNFAALGLSVFGLLVAIYGVAARTVIPWD
jgi:hypothetical protein